MLEILASKKTILFTCSTEKGLNAPFHVEQIKNRTRDVSLTESKRVRIGVEDGIPPRKPQSRTPQAPRSGQAP